MLGARKVLTVSPYFDSHRGGVEIVAGRLARELAGRGIGVTWCACSASAPAADIACATLRSWNVTERRLGVPYPLLGPGAVATLVREVRACDAVLVHDALYATSIVSMIAAKLLGRPVVMVQHIGQIPYAAAPARLIMKLANAVIARGMLSLADQVVFISEIAARFFATVRFRRPPVMIFNGVDVAIFQPPSPERRRVLREKLGLSADRPQALFVGRFVEKKGLRHLEKLAALRADIDWLFAGWGGLDPERWGRPNVRVFRDLAGAGLAELYQACDVFVLPSVGEGFPLVIQEALACGRPVVCGAESRQADLGAADLLIGVDLAAGNAQEAALRLSMAVDLALTSTDESLVTRRSELARERYAWSAIGDRYADLLHGLAAERLRPKGRPA